MDIMQIYQTAKDLFVEVVSKDLVSLLPETLTKDTPIEAILDWVRDPGLYVRDDLYLLTYGGTKARSAVLFEYVQGEFEFHQYSISLSVLEHIEDYDHPHLKSFECGLKEVLNQLN